MAVNEQIETLCKELQLPSLAKTYHELGNRAAKESWKYSEYLYECKKCTKPATLRVSIRPPMTPDIRPPLSLDIRPLLTGKRDFILA